MLFQVDAFDLPEWAHDELRAHCADWSVGEGELVKYLVCTYIKSLSSPAETQFTVPPDMEARMVAEGFMVVRRSVDGVVMTPSEPMSFEDALAEFQSNGLTEDDVMQIIKGRAGGCPSRRARGFPQAICRKG